MNLTIAKKDLQAARDIFYDYCIGHKESDTYEVARKMITKLNRLLKEAYGHDCKSGGNPNKYTGRRMLDRRSRQQNKNV